MSDEMVYGTYSCNFQQWVTVVSELCQLWKKEAGFHATFCLIKTPRVTIPRLQLQVTDGSLTFQFGNLNQPPPPPTSKRLCTWSFDSFKYQLPYRCDKMKKHLTQAVFRYWLIYMLIINMSRWKERAHCTWLLAAAKDLHGPCTDGGFSSAGWQFRHKVKRKLVSLWPQMVSKRLQKILQQKDCHSCCGKAAAVWWSCQ